MMGIGFPELMIILVIIMIIFGAGKLPEIGNAFGRSIKNFKQSMKEAEQEEVASEESANAEMKSSETSAVEQNQEGEGQKQEVKTAAKTEEEKMIEEAALEIKEKRIGTIKTKHDGLVQQGDVFTDSLSRTPFGRGRDRGVSRDVF